MHGSKNGQHPLVIRHGMCTGQSIWRNQMRDILAVICEVRRECEATSNRMGDARGHEWATERPPGQQLVAKPRQGLHDCFELRLFFDALYPCVPL